VLSIGITGHRPNRMHIGVARVEARLVQVLRALHKGVGREEKSAAVSALAEGSDRLFAKVALGLGFDLRILLPFNSVDYETTFGDAAATHLYHALLVRASQITELPGTLTDSTAGYEAVGRLTVEQSDVLIAVWDGKPAAGRGGTPEIMQYALDLDRPVIWIDAARDRPPLLLRTPSASGVRSVPLAKLAPRAQSLSQRKVSKLALLAKQYLPHRAQSLESAAPS
jgi:hypothetical protein